MMWRRTAATVGCVLMLAGPGTVPAAGMHAQEATPAGVDCPVTTPEENKALVENYWNEVYNEQNPERVEDFLSDDFTRNNLARPQDNEPGHADDIARAAENIEDFPDIQISVDDMVAEGEMVAARLTWTGTQEDGIAQFNTESTGNEATFALMAFYRVECSKLAEQWIVFDYLSMVRQLGLVTDAELASIGDGTSAAATPDAP